MAQTFYKGQYVKVNVAVGPFPAGSIFIAQYQVMIATNYRRSPTRGKALRVLGPDGVFYDIALTNISTPTTAEISLYQTVTSKQTLPKLAFKFDGVNDQIETKYPSGAYQYGTIVKKNDGVRDYWSMASSFFYFSSVTPLDSRKQQVQKFTAFYDVFGKQVALGSYAGNTVVKIASTGKIEVELQGTGSIRVSGGTVLTPGVVYNIIVRINNDLPSGTARVVGDCDIFINGVKETLTPTSTSTSTSTTTDWYWGAVHSSNSVFFGGLYNAVLWSGYIDDTDIAKEGASPYAVVNPGAVLAVDTTNTQAIHWKQPQSGVVSGNLSNSSDVNGEYLYANGNKDSVSTLGSRADLTLSSGLGYTQNENFSFATRVQFDNLPANGFSGVFGAGGVATISIDSSTGKARATLAGSSTVTFDSLAVINTAQLYRFDFCYDAQNKKFFFYIDGVLQNTGGTTGPTTFTCVSRTLGDGAVGGSASTVTSCTKRYYWSRVYNKCLSSSDIAVEMLNPMAEPDDAMMSASRRPENLKYNVQYLLNTKDLSNASWTKGSGTSVVANAALDEDGNMLASRVTWSGTSTTVSQVYQAGTPGLSGSVIANRTFKVKAFVRAVSGSALFRLQLDQVGVSTFTSSDFTATSVMQEFEFSVTLASGTGASALRAALVCGSTNLAGVIDVGEVTLWHVNRYVYDNTSNIAGRIGWKTNKVVSFYVKPTQDGVNTASSQVCLNIPFLCAYIRDTNNAIRVRYDVPLQAKETSYILGSGFRKEVFFVGAYYWNESLQVWTLQIWIYLEGVLIGNSTTNMSLDAPTGTVSSTIACGRNASTYLGGYLRDISVYTGTILPTEPQNMANGAEPLTAVRHTNWLPSANELSTETIDNTGNGHTGFLKGGMVKEYIYTT